MDYKLNELIDIALLQDLQEKLNLVYSFPSAVIDIEGNILTAVAWQDVCTKFHRINPECEKECKLSDQYIMDHLHEANPAVSYRCPHGLVDNATPIIIEGTHYGNFFTGQFFTENPNMEFFSQQAKKYGFDEKEYLAAVEKVPVWTKEKLHLYLDFIKGFIEMIASIGLKNLKENRIKEELKESEEQFYNLYINAPIGIFHSNLEGTFLNANPALANMLGYSSSEELIATTFNITTQIYADPNVRLQVIEALTKTDDWVHYDDIKWKRKDNTIITVDLTGRRVLKDSGEFAYLEGFIKDISEHKLAEEKLIRSEEKYRTIFENIQDVFYQIDLNGIIKEISPSVCRFSDYKREDLIGTEIVNYYYSEDERDLFLSTIKQTGKVFDFELRFINKFGDLKYTSVNAHVCFDSEGNPIYIEGVMRDIHERKLAEEKLNDSFTRYQSLITNLEAGVVIHSLDTSIILNNQRACELLGLSEDQMRGKLAIDPRWKFIHENYIPLTLEEFPVNRVIATNKSFNNFTVGVIIPENNNIVWLTVNGTPFYNSNGEMYEILISFLDITEHKKAEETNANLAQRLQFIISNQPYGILVVDKEGNGEYANQSFCDLICENEKPENLIGLSGDEIIEKILPTYADPNIVLSMIKNVVANNKPFHDYETTMKNGSKLLVDFEPLIIDGKDTGRMWIHRDITERKLAEEKLIESQSKYFNLYTLVRLMSDTMPDMLWAKDVDNRFIFANKAVCENLLIATDTSEPIGKDDFYFVNRQRILHPEDPNWHTFGELCVNSDEITKKEMKLMQFDEYGNIRGKFLYLDVHKAPLYNDKNEFIGLVGSGRDVTERKQAEAKLVESEIKYRNIFENAQEGIFQTNLDGTYISVNPALAKMYGFDSPEELMSTRIDIAKDAYSNPKERDYFLKLMNEQGFIKGFEYEVKRKDGSKMWFYEDATAMKDENGTIKFFEGFVIDITERKQAEKELLIAKEKAEASDRLKTAFLNNISHEIRTPLNGILGFATLIVEPNITEEEKNEYLKVLNNSGYRLIKTVTDYMDISLITSGNMEVSNKNFSLYNLFESLIKENSEQLKSTDLDIQFHLPDEMKSIELCSDLQLLVKALGNLLDNAFKFTKQGEINIGVEIRDEQIAFFVKDTGKGIATEAKEIIFNVFMQENILNTRGYEGSGLGLSIVKGIMNLLGGDVSFESEINKGSTFYLSLPFSKPSEINIVATKDFTQKGKDNFVILIVEDDEVSCQFIEIFMGKVSNRILKVDNGKDAVLVCRNNPDIDLILMDIKMFGINGYETTRLIREFNKEVIIIAQSAYALIGDKEIAIEAGCNDYITKPIDFNLLMGMINKYFNF